MIGGPRKFYDHWRSSSYRFDLPKRFPYNLPLKAPLPLGPYSTLNNEIVVTKGYYDMYYRILGLRMLSPGLNGGIVLTGQPGIGEPL